MYRLGAESKHLYQYVPIVDIQMERKTRFNLMPETLSDYETGDYEPDESDE